MQPSRIPAPHYLRHYLIQNYQEILALIEAENPDIRAIARQTADLPLLADAVLKRVNAVGYRTKYPIRDVEHAVVFLGIKRIEELVRKMLDELDAAPTSSGHDPAQHPQPPSSNLITNRDM